MAKDGLARAFYDSKLATLPLAGGEVDGQEAARVQEAIARRLEQDACYSLGWEDARRAIAGTLCEHCRALQPVQQARRGKRAVPVFVHHITHWDVRWLRQYTKAVPCAASGLWELTAPTYAPDNEPPVVEEVAVCPDCDEVQEDPEAGHECGACGNQFMRSDGEGQGNTCPECHKWAGKIADQVCPNDFTELETADRVHDTQGGGGEEWLTVEAWNKKYLGNQVRQEATGDGH